MSLLKTDKEKTWTQRRSCQNRSRDWNYTVTIQGTSSATKNWKREKDCTSELSEFNIAAILILDFWLPEL
jgi:hypothetical protein